LNSFVSLLNKYKEKTKNEWKTNKQI
jgi:hypothetical protein